MGPVSDEEGEMIDASKKVFSGREPSRWGDAAMVDYDRW
jgi:hypothetical protein